MEKKFRVITFYLDLIRVCYALAAFRLHFLLEGRLMRLSGVRIHNLHKATMKQNVLLFNTLGASSA